MEKQKPSRDSFLRQIKATFGWSRSSYFLLSLFLATILLIMYIWWPLAEEYLSYINPDYPIWRQLDWLLIGIFLVMSLLIMAGANLKQDAWIIIIGLFGGLVIESWGTQTNIWHYYTNERPPLWIIPAWPIASLSIDRLVRMLHMHIPKIPIRIFQVIYWLVFPFFIILMLLFVRYTFDKSLTWMAFILCVFLMLTPTDYRLSVLTFAAGTGLGYFLEKWGTTRECWIYYTEQTPPLFAVLAHGLATVAFWRTVLLFKLFADKIITRRGNVNEKIVNESG